MREPGFYWVKYKGKWIIAQWGNQHLEPGMEWYWDIIEVIDEVDDNSFDEIDERRIVREETTNEQMKAYCLKRLQELAINGDLDCLD